MITDKEARGISCEILLALGDPIGENTRRITNKTLEKYNAFIWIMREIQRRQASKEVE